MRNLRAVLSGPIVGTVAKGESGFKTNEVDSLALEDSTDEPMAVDPPDAQEGAPVTNKLQRSHVRKT